MAGTLLMLGALVLVGLIAALRSPSPSVLYGRVPLPPPRFSREAAAAARSAGLKVPAGISAPRGSAQAAAKTAVDPEAPWTSPAADVERPAGRKADGETDNSERARLGARGRQQGAWVCSRMRADTPPSLPLRLALPPPFFRPFHLAASQPVMDGSNPLNHASVHDAMMDPDYRPALRSPGPHFGASSSLVFRHSVPPCFGSTLTPRSYHMPVSSYPPS
eukprot:2590693-Rhodomonas_salina.2